MAKVSVIVPVYNVEDYLVECLESLVSQTLKEIEIICVNDGSTDSSLQILEQYAQKDSRIVIYNQENSGLSVARNTGLEHASGEYIGFVDSDDWVDLDFYEKLYNSAKNNNADIAVADFIREHPNKKPKRLKLKEEKIYTTPEDKFMICKVHREGCVRNKIYRTEFIHSINLKFVPKMYYEDRDFTIRSLYFSKKLVTTPNTYYRYFVNPKSIVNKRRNYIQDEHYILVRQQVLQFIKEHNIKVPDGLYKAEIYRYKLFGKTLFTIKESINTKYIFLFGKIQIFKMRLKNNG